MLLSIFIAMECHTPRVAISQQLLYLVPGTEYSVPDINIDTEQGTNMSRAILLLACYRHVAKHLALYRSNIIMFCFSKSKRSLTQENLHHFAEFLESEELQRHCYDS